MPKKEKPNCPECGSKNIAYIVYGEVAFNDKELNDALDKGEIHLGGCCISKNSPAYHCNDCGKEYGRYEEII